MGGLGNQLFQLAHGLAKAPQSKPNLVSGLSHSRRNLEGKPEIYSFTVTEFASSSEIEPIRWVVRIHNLLVRISVHKKPGVLARVTIKPAAFLLSGLLGKKLGRNFLRIKVSRGVDFANQEPDSKDTLHLGYFQSAKHLSNPRVVEKMQSLRALATSPVLDELRQLSQLEKPLVVHVRLGDYKQEANIGMLNQSYYQRALKQACRENEFEKIWVFSDEIEVAKNYIPMEYHHIVRWIPDVENSPALTFEAMRLGNVYVIANSTYSWWAAAISRNPSPNVYCPMPWYAGDNSPDKIIPGHWHTIPRV
jgi:hypothetical protein